MKAPQQKRAAVLPPVSVGLFHISGCVFLRLEGHSLGSRRRIRKFADIPDMVYVVEDEPSLLNAILRLLRLGGIAATGFDTSGKLADCLPLSCRACLVVDIALRNETGLNLPSRLFGRGEVPPLVFVSATRCHGPSAPKRDGTGQTQTWSSFEFETSRTNRRL